MDSDRVLGMGMGIGVMSSLLLAWQRVVFESGGRRVSLRVRHIT